MENLTKTFYDEKTDGRYMPVGLGSFGQVCLEQPLVMCVYCGFVERFGLNNLQILKSISLFGSLRPCSYIPTLDAEMLSKSAS